MRKILSFVLIAAILVASLGLVSCQEKKSAYEVVSEAITKTTSMNSFSFNCNLKSSTTEDGETTNEDIKLEYVISGIKNEKPEYSAKITTSAENMTITMGYVFKGGTYYVDAFGFKVKTSEGDEGFDEQGLDDMEPKTVYEMLIVQIPEELLKDAEIKEEDGKKSVEISIPAEKFTEVFKKWGESMNEEEGDTKLSDIKLEIVIAENGYLAEYNLSFGVEETYEGVVSKGTGSYFITFNNPGQEASVELPEDAADYMSAAEMAG